MPSLKQLVVAATALSLTTAAPHEKRAPSFEIKQSANPVFVKNGYMALAKALSKYGGAQERITHAIKKGQAQSGSVSANPQQYDSQYLSPVTIGNQKFTLNFDTGSSDTWVFGQSASSAGGSHTYYRPSSSSKKIQGATWSISYGDGSTASGSVYTDTVNIGGVSVTGQAIESASTVSSSFTSGPADGLVGLGFDVGNTVKPAKQKTLLTNLGAQGVPAILSADLKHNVPGTYTFGNVPSNGHSGSIVYTPVDSSQGYWTFTPSSGERGIADTGTTLVLLSTSGTQNYWSGVSSATQDSQGNWSFDCNESLPDFSITVGSYRATVPGDFINFAPNGDGTCFGGIQDVGSIPFAIYGDVFLKSQFVVFDKSQGSPRLGLARKA